MSKFTFDAPLGAERKTHSQVHLEALAKFIESHGNEIVQITDTHVVFKSEWINTLTKECGCDLEEAATLIEAKTKLGY